jgi:hypothetical protein
MLFHFLKILDLDIFHKYIFIIDSTSYINYLDDNNYFEKIFYTIASSIRLLFILILEYYN